MPEPPRKREGRIHGNIKVSKEHHDRSIKEEVYSQNQTHRHPNGTPHPIRSQGQGGQVQALPTDPKGLKKNHRQEQEEGQRPHQTDPSVRPHEPKTARGQAPESLPTR